jgi:UDP-GlcNAc3NAcA epimerase
MSDIFFGELQIPHPDYNLNVGSDIHGKQTARMLVGIEDLLVKLKPDYLILYGDTNSTLAGSVAASKLHIPIVHIEAGMRSFNKSMPEEINRIVCDHCSTLLFSPTKTGYDNLIREGFPKDSVPPFTPDNPHVFHCGDVMFDNSLFFAEIAETQSDIMNTYKLTENNYILSTIHRDKNTDNPQRLNSIFSSLNKISVEANINIILPLHPRTAKYLKKNLNPGIYNSIHNNHFFKITEPVSFLDMIMLEKKCRMIFTDSGGVQKEAYFFKKPCGILRPETEWVEIVRNNAALITDTDEEKILQAWNHFKDDRHSDFPPVFGDGNASEFICQQLINNAQ